MWLTIFTILFQTSNFAAPSAWTLLGWSIAAIVAILYLFTGLSDKMSLGRKELLDVNEKKLTNAIKEKDEAIFRINELQRQVEKLEKDKADVEKEKLMLMREHHQLLEISVTDLQTLRNNTKLIEQMEDEVNKLREAQGLAPRPKFQPNVRNE
jgi:CRISPR/Cas system CMR-associated protein Cmr1 (group 7 of RAMP superfamily)